MKHFLIILTLVISFAGNVFAQGFNSVHSPDGNTVVAVGDDGLIFISTNGGNNWGHINYTPAYDFTDVFTLGNKCWITTSIGNIILGDLSTYNFYEYLSSGEKRSITFINSMTGFVCGSNSLGYNYRITNDGGISWGSPASSGINGTDTLNSISFMDANNGVIVGNSGKIYFTTNGGSNWTSQASGTTFDLLEVKYFSTGIIIVGEYGTLLVKNSTGPGAFAQVNSRVISDINGVGGVNYSSAKIAGGGGFIRNNNGSSLFLNFEENPMAANLVDIYFSDANTGYAVSSKNKAVIKTNNGGTTWSLTGGTTISYLWQNKLTSGSGIGNGFFYFPSKYQSPQRRDLVYIAQGNKIFRSYNGGDNWTQIATISLGSRAHSFYINPLDTNLMVAAMDQSGGRVARSTDHGVTWVQTWTGNLTSYGMPLEMDPSFPNNMILAPDNSVPLKSTDFGATWSNLSAQQFSSPCDIIIHPENSNVVYIGDQSPSTFWKSTNGGLTWASKNTVAASEIPMIGVSQLDTTLVFHTVWSGGSVYRSTNVGENFTVASTTTSSWGCDVSKDDPTAFLFSTYGSPGGFITLNKGTSFTGVGYIGSSNAGVLYLDKGNVMAQGTGTAVHKLAITYNVSSSPIVITGITNGNGSIPETFALSQNYPNPFNPATRISYQLPEAGLVKITVFDISGKEVATLVNAHQNAGYYDINFDGSALSSGVYFYKLEASSFVETKKMLLVK